MPKLAQHHHGVLGGLGLELVGGGNVRHQGNVHEHAVVRAEIAAHFAGGLKEGLGLDVADGTTDFGDDHIHVIGSLGAHTRLDFVGDVRDNLHALAEVFAGALLAQHFLIDLTGGDVGLSGSGRRRGNARSGRCRDRFRHRLRSRRLHHAGTGSWCPGRR